MTDSDSDDGTLSPVLGAPPPPLPAPPPSGSAPAAEETPGAIVPVKRGRGRPPGSRNKPKTNPSPRSSRLARTTRRRGERSPSTRPDGSRRSSRQPCTSSRASPGVYPQSDGPPGASRALADQVLPPVHHGRDDRGDCGEHYTNDHLHATLCMEPPARAESKFLVGSRLCQVMHLPR